MKSHNHSILSSFDIATSPPEQAMGYMLILSLFVFIVPCYCEGSAKISRCQQPNDIDISGEFVYVLRGIDGIPGRNGRQGAEGPNGMNATLGGPRGECGPQGIPGPPGPPNGGATYIRWGHTACPDGVSTELVHSGFAGGTYFNSAGGGANYLCLPSVPNYNTSLKYRPGVQHSSPVHGAEYEAPLQGTQNHNVPCAVCRVPTRRTIVMMIPAMASCPPSWTREYNGYLMSGHASHKRTLFVCMDQAMQSLPDSAANTNGALFYHTEATCSTGLKCPPYNANDELNCVVCTM